MRKLTDRQQKAIDRVNNGITDAIDIDLAKQLHKRGLVFIMCMSE